MDATATVSPPKCSPAVCRGVLPSTSSTSRALVSRLNSGLKKWLRKLRDTGAQHTVRSPHADGQAALRVSVHQQNLFALGSNADTQIFTGRGLSGAAFLVDNGNRSTFLCDKIIPLVSHAQSHGSFNFDRLAALWSVRCTEKRAGIVSCFGSGCCSLQGTSAQSGYGRRSAS